MTDRQAADGPPAARNLAVNVAAMRRARNFSQTRLSDLAGVPRSTISHIESGVGNPALATLTRIAAALSVGLDELVSAPRSAVALLTAREVPIEQRSDGRVQIYKLLPERVRGLDIERMELAGRATMKGTPHLAGTKEYLHVLEGVMQVLLSGQFHDVESGDVLAFPGSQAHSYRNPARVTAVAISVVVPNVG
ncbi:MAG: helix-turn-helix domain-containing protein [Pseudomonadota bacterium]